jgi:EAL domain-containing protein (putative c-di-GMP-specific phosphodiesterase class I)
LNVLGKVIGCEVLLRWQNNLLGKVSPEHFIPVSESNGLIIEIGDYVLENSFKTLREWYDAGIILEQFSVNISIRQFFHPGFVKQVKALIHQYLNDTLCSKLIFEITETSVADSIDELIAIMLELKKLGIRFSMDDFGTGYSSLSYLKRLPLDELKIDKSFLANFDEVNDKKMIKTILSIAEILNLTVVAEGVESKEQQEFLAANGCDVLQGFYFSKPILKEEFIKFIS